MKCVDPTSEYFLGRMGPESKMMCNGVPKGKGGNVTSAGWQVTLCDPMWHVSSRSGAATSRTAIYTCYLHTYLLT